MAIAELLASASGGNGGFGGRTVQLEVGEVRVFCKMVPLTSLEKDSANHQSTKNLFQLPPYYQYGIGSTGFGAWRELAAHVLTSVWALEGQHEQFPLLYHWRVIQCSDAGSDGAEAYEYLTHPAAAGEDESVIRQRLEALRTARTHIAIFTEHFPITLSQWLLEQLRSDQSSASAAVQFVEANSFRAIDFMRRQRFYHFDTHLDNILTDGSRLYFADFGLAVHGSFDLGKDERNFLEQHAQYDAVRFGSSLVHTICRAIPGEESWSEKLKRPDLQANSLPFAAFAALQRHAPAAVYMGQFARNLINTDRHTAFKWPSAALA